jgi:hypothetical protein
MCKMQVTGCNIGQIANNGHHERDHPYSFAKAVMDPNGATHPPAARQAGCTPTRKCMRARWSSSSTKAIGAMWA